MTTNLKAIRIRISEANDAELLQMLNDERSNWQPEALAFAQAELSRRKITGPQERETYREETKESAGQHLHGIEKTVARQEKVRYRRMFKNLVYLIFAILGNNILAVTIQGL